MRQLKYFIPIITAFIMIAACASGKVEYDLPSVETVEQPEWFQPSQDTGQDSIYLVIKVPLKEDADMTQAIQDAQSRLNDILQVELEVLVREYMESLKPPYPEDVVFERTSEMPALLEKVMILVEVRDAWESSGQIAVLCAFDHAEVASVIVKELKIRSEDFTQFFKWKMNNLGKLHQ